jgi:hypothetical protein
MFDRLEAVNPSALSNGAAGDGRRCPLIPGSKRYVHVFLVRPLILTRLHGKFLRTGLTALAAQPGKDRSLTAASRAYTAAIDDLARQAGLAA